MSHVDVMVAGARRLRHQQGRLNRVLAEWIADAAVREAAYLASGMAPEDPEPCPGDEAYAAWLIAREVLAAGGTRRRGRWWRGVLPLRRVRGPRVPYPQGWSG